MELVRLDSQGNPVRGRHGNGEGEVSCLIGPRLESFTLLTVLVQRPDVQTPGPGASQGAEDDPQTFEGHSLHVDGLATELDIRRAHDDGRKHSTSLCRYTAPGLVRTG